MNDFKWLPEQEKIINLQNKNLIVSASAGSGKTTIMIEKIVRLIKNKKIPLSSLLVLTYTKSAAHDMKDKLERSLIKENATTEILDELPNCDISTIHSFCQKQLKKYFNVVNIDYAFDIVEDTKKLLLKESALKQTLNYFKGCDPERYLTLLKMFKNGRSETSIKNIIFTIEDFLSTIVDKDKFRTSDAFTVYDNIEQDIKIINNYFIENANMFIRNFSNILEKCFEVDAETYCIMCNEIISSLHMLSENFCYDENFENLLNIKLPTLKKIEGCESLHDIIDKEKSSLSRFLSYAKKLDFRNRIEIEKVFKNNRQTLQFIFEIEKLYEKNYKQIKLKQNLMDFADLEDKMLELLENPIIAKEIKDNYKYIFIDEFQDANDTQEKLISALCSSNNRFMVGDVKQSIYGFRRSNPEIFLSKEKEYQNRIDSQAMYLNVNFRSDKKILEFANTVFSKIMTERTCQINYEQKAKFEAFEDLGKTQYPKIKISVVNKVENNEKLSAPKIYSVLNHEECESEFSYAVVEADLVAEEILNLYGKNISIKEQRPIKFSDITILLRKRGDYFDKFCSRLLENNVPIYASSKTNLMEENEVIKLLSLLKLTLYPNDEIALVSTMMSPIGEFDENQLIQIRKESNDSFFECYNLFLQKNDELSLKIKKFNQTIEKFKFEVQVYGVAQALNNILRESNYKLKIMPMADGKNKVACIDKFIQVISSSGYNFDLINLLDFLQLENANIKAPDFYLGDSDCVNITTIHSSKGLEYPIVFLVNAGENFMLGKKSGEIEMNDKLGICLKPILDDSSIKFSDLAKLCIKFENEKDDFAERLRLLYVAMTRAKNALYIFGSTPISKLYPITNELDVLSIKSYLSLIIGSMPKKCIDYIKKGEDFFLDEYTEITVCDQFESQVKQQVKNVMFGSYDKKIKSAIENNFMAPFDEQIALKNSVSSLIASSTNYESYNPYPIRLTVDEHNPKNITAQMGSEYHKALEVLNFSEINNIKDVQNALSENVYFQNVDLDYKKIYDCCLVLKNLFSGHKNILKEKKFIMRVPYKEVCSSEKNDEVLVQGVIDCFSTDGILVDYKLTKTSDRDTVVKKYSKQLSLYKKALELGYNIKKMDCYILLIDNATLVKMPI